MSAHKIPTPAPLLALRALTAVFALAACATPRLGDGDLPPRPASLRAAFDAMPAPVHGRLRILDDNVDAWLARWRTIAAADKSVDVQYFIIEPDAFGLSLLGLLYEKQLAGVQVRLMVDSRGTPTLTRDFVGIDLLREMAAAGVAVRIYNPVETNIADTLASGDLRRITASNHDKLIIADRRATITGGRNISRDYLSDVRDHPSAYIDMDVFVEGESAALAFTEAFSSELEAKRAVAVKPSRSASARDALLLAAGGMRLWLTAPALGEDELAALAAEERRDELARVVERDILAGLGHMPEQRARDLLREVTRLLAKTPRLRGALARPVPPISAEPDQVQILDTHSSEGPTRRNRVNENLLAAIQAAEREVVIQSPYFVLTTRGMRALEDAARRGVGITILTNSPVSSDSPITQAAFLRQWPELLERVPTARLFVVGEERLMHAKVGVMDGVLSFVGSYNLDPLSAGVNGEVLSAVWSEAFAGKQRELIFGRIALGRPRVYEYRIRRDEDGKAVRAGGRIVVELGPEDHCDEQELKKVKRLEPVLDLLAPLI